MRHLSAVILLCGIILFTGCSSDDGTSPDGNGGGGEIQDSATVGTAGGSLEGDDFTVTIPAGAFDRDYELELSASDAEQPWGAATVTAVYRLDGAPEDHAEPLQIFLPGELVKSDADTVFVAIGVETFVPSLAASEVAYRIYCALRCDSGYCVELPSCVQGDAGFFSAEKGRVRAIYMFRTPHLAIHQPDGGHFRIYYPRGLVESSLIEDDLITWLDDAYTTFESDLGFSYAGKEWPMEVYAYPFPAQAGDPLIGGAWVPHALGIDWGFIQINAVILPNEAVGKTVAGHEFFHFVQNLYDPRSAYTIADETARHLWLMEACSVWSEELFADNPLDYVPPALAFYPRTCLDEHGLQPAASVAAGPHAAHGYGMGALIKHLAETYENNKIRLIWQNIRTGHHPVGAVIAAVGEEPSEWWPPFLDRYLAGDIYDQGAGSFLPATLDSFVIAAHADTVKRFTATYPDISAKLYKVNLEDPGMGDDAILTFSAAGTTPEPGISVFRRLGPDIDLLAHGQGTVSVPDAGVLMDQGCQVMVVVQNCAFSAPDYEGSRNITLEIRRQELPDWRQVDISVVLEAMLRNEDGEVYHHHGVNAWCSCVISEVSNRITESWEDIPYGIGGLDTGELTIVMNPSFTHVDSFSVTRTILYDDGIISSSASGVDIAFMESSANLDFFQYDGYQANDHVLTFEYYSLRNGVLVELVSIIWDAENNVSITFDRDPPP